MNGFIPVDGTELYYEMAGSGVAERPLRRQPLVLIHAGIADQRMWDDQWDVFAQNYQVVRYDVRGFGRSMNPAGDYTDHDDLHTLLTTLGIERPILLGCSNGGRIAINYTLTHPDNVSALIVVGPSVEGFEYGEAVKAGWKAEGEAYEQGGMWASAEMELRMWVDGKGRTPDQVDLYVRERVREMLITTYQIPEELDCGRLQRLDPYALSRLGEITIPTLAIVGDLDFDDKMTIVDLIVEHVANAQKVVMHGTAHMPNMEQPERFTNIVEEFLSANS